MTTTDPKSIALQFNDCINARDIDGLAQLMTDDHTFIDTADNTMQGKLSCLAGWREFFNSFPDYKNIFETVKAKGTFVIMIGHSTCTDKRLEGPALWTAKIRDEKVAAWRVYEDTADNRHRLDYHMNTNKINIFEFPSNLGLKKTASEIEPGVKLLPSWLRKHQFYELINPEQVFTLTPPDYSMDLDGESWVRNAEKIINYAIEQDKLLSKHIKPDSFQIIIGGDCSILIGNALALRQKGEYGLFFLDGHTDFILPDLSQTGGAAGMDLAIVTGYGHEKLTDILKLKPYFKEKNVWCVGNRAYDPNYVKPILDTGINYFDLKTLRKTGIENCTAQFLDMVGENKLDGFFIHLDVDVLNDDIMPAVDSREIDGLEYFELTNLLGKLLSSPKAIGIEITILDPNLDKEGKYTKEFISNFMKAIEIGKKM